MVSFRGQETPRRGCLSPSTSSNSELVVPSQLSHPSPPLLSNKKAMTLLSSRLKLCQS